MEIIKNLCMQYLSQIQNIILILLMVIVFVAVAYERTYSNILLNIFFILIFMEFFCFSGVHLAKLKEKEIKEQLLAASSKEEIQGILEDVPKLSIINLKKDLETERKIVLYNIEELLIKLENK